jgi:hypothetical protein
MFYFYSPLQTVFSSPTVSDTTVGATASPTRTTVKSYTLNVPAGANRIRVLIYGRVGSEGLRGAIFLNVDGNDVASVFITNSSEALVIDFTGSITPGSRTIRVDAQNIDGVTVYLTKVYVVTGIALTSTTPADIISFTVTYQLLRQGDIRYSPGIRVFVFGNRKTTAPMTLTLGLTSEIRGRNNIGAGNDNDRAETILAILTGSVTLQEGGEFTVSATLRGAVGASGDVVIITRILARAQLRRDILEFTQVRVYEMGVVEYFGRALLVSVPGGCPNTYHYIMQRNILDRFVRPITISGSGTDVTLLNYRIAVVAPIHFGSACDEDLAGESFIEWVQLVVWG